MKTKIVIGFAAIVLTLPVLAYAAAEPDSFIRYALLRTAYSLPVTRGWMLRQYSNFLDNHNAGNMGAAIDTFLCSRLESSPSENEMVAILGFYILRAGASEGDQIPKVSDNAKQRAFPLLLGRLNTFNERQSYGALVIVEEMRRGETICKAGLASFNEQEWRRGKGLPEAKDLYQRWWNLNLSWQEKKETDPLKGSNIRISAHCG